MHRSDTSTHYRNTRTILYCRMCGGDKDFCTCWMDFISKLEIVLLLKLKLGIYKCLKIKKRYIQVINLIRRTPHSISGMKGLKLLERINKR